jgi:anti-sigma factor RsiW
MVCCRSFLQSLCDYLDGALSAPSRSACDLHAQTCARCGVLLETTRRTVQLYRRSITPDVPPEVERRVLMAIESSGARGPDR